MGVLFLILLFPRVWQDTARGQTDEIGLALVLFITELPYLRYLARSLLICVIYKSIWFIL